MRLSTWCAGLRQEAGLLVAPQVTYGFAYKRQPCTLHKVSEQYSMYRSCQPCRHHTS